MPSTLEITSAIEQHRNQRQEPTSLTPLQKHILIFGDLGADNTLRFSADSIAGRLEKHGESNPQLVGSAVFIFNSTVAGQCPCSGNIFSKNGDDSFGSKLHLGTFRVYNPDGSVNPENLDYLLQHLADDEGYISESKLIKSLGEYTKKAPHDMSTGRHPGFFGKTASTNFQLFAIEKAYSEVFKILACKWTSDTTVAESCIHADLLRLFFEDAPLCMQVALDLKLPQQQSSEITEGEAMHL